MSIAEQNHSTQKIIDIALSTDWDYDRDFINLLEQQAKDLGLTTYVIWTGILDHIYSKLQEGDLKFQFLLDRASDTTPEFYKIQKWVKEHQGQIFESLEKLQWASDKATMHLEFLAHGLHTPYTYIMTPYERQKQELHNECKFQNPMGLSLCLILTLWTSSVCPSK